jgi:hypothetical protein
MRTQPRHRPLIPFLAVASLLACVTAHVFAQETANTGKEGKVAAPSYDLEIKDGLLIWNGAKRKDNANQVPPNLQNVVDLLRELHPEANFAVSPEVRDNVVADLKMRTSSVEEKLEAIRIASGSDFMWRNAQVPTVSTVDPATGLPTKAGNTPALYVLEAVPAAPKPGLQLEAFNISGYLDTLHGMAPDEVRARNAEQMDQLERMVLVTVKEYQGMSQVENSKAKPLRTPSIRFHPGANLVIIIGDPEAVAVAAKVVGALPGVQRSVASNASGYLDDAAMKSLQRDGPGPTRRR